MYPRTNYEMTQEDLDTLLGAMKPVPYMIIGGSPPRSQQENANAAWASLGSKMGFDPMSVRPIEGMGNRHFSAIPSETESQRVERTERESEAARTAEIYRLEAEISDRKAKLAELGVRES
jgi:hypothetical protein